MNFLKFLGIVAAALACGAIGSYLLGILLPRAILNWIARRSKCQQC
jgi:hypothetical protein